MLYNTPLREKCTGVITVSQHGPANELDGAVMTRTDA